MVLKKEDSISASAKGKAALGFSPNFGKEAAATSFKTKLGGKMYSKFAASSIGSKAQFDPEDLNLSQLKKKEGENLGQEKNLDFLAKPNGTNFFNALT